MDRLRAAVAAEIARLERSGVPRASAIAAAFAAARVKFFKAHPHGAVPAWLAWPKGYRLKQFYDRAGKPVQSNPDNDKTHQRTASWVIVEKSTGKPVMETYDEKKVAALNTRKYEAVPIRQYLGSLNTRHKNPVRQLDIPESERRAILQDVQSAFSGRGRAVRKAAKLYTEFTGHDDPEVVKVSVPSIPRAALNVGLVDGILYTTVRDGVTEKYIHRFKGTARPQLAASPDGKQLFLIGGAYTFTERGIVDKK